MRYLKLIVVFFILACLAHAALPSTTVWETRNAGNDANGGGYVTGSSGTDYSQQNSAQYTASDLSCSGSCTTNPCQVFSTATGFLSDIVGDIIQINSGTGWTTGFYEVVSFNGSGLITLDRACGNGNNTGGVFHIGGALATLSKLNTAMGTTANISQVAWVKNDSTYSVSSQAANFNFTTNGCNNCQPQINGYTSSRGDNGMPTIQASAAINNSMIEISNNNNLNGLMLRNFIIDCNSKSNSYGLQIASNTTGAENIKVTNCTNDGIRMEDGADQCRWCYVTGTSGGTAAINIDGVNASSSQPSMCYFCVAYSNTIAGIRLVNSICINCISGNNSGASSDGFGINTSSGQGSSWIINSVAYNNGRDGIRLVTVNSEIYQILNTIISQNAGWGINSTTTVASGQIYENYNFFYSNTSGARTGLSAGANDVTGTGDPFTAGGSNNYALNNTAGAGAAARAAGFPGALLVGGTGHIDIGALQHGDPASSGGQHTNVIIQ